MFLPNFPVPTQTPTPPPPPSVKFSIPSHQICLTVFYFPSPFSAHFSFFLSPCHSLSPIDTKALLSQNSVLLNFLRFNASKYIRVYQRRHLSSSVHPRSWFIKWSLFPLYVTWYTVLLATGLLIEIKDKIKTKKTLYET